MPRLAFEEDDSSPDKFFRVGQAADGVEHETAKLVEELRKFRDFGCYNRRLQILDMMDILEFRLQKLRTLMNE